MCVSNSVVCLLTALIIAKSSLYKMEGVPESEFPKKKGYGITPRSLCGDGIIEDFFTILRERSDGLTGVLKVYNFPTVFFTAIDAGGFQRVARWTRRVKITNYDVLLFPVHVPSKRRKGVAHWYLIAAFLKEKLVRSYDSLGREHPERLKGCLDYLEWEMRRIGTPMNRLDWTLKGNPTGLRKQENGIDCGFFVCFYAGCITKKLNPAAVKSPNSVELRRFVSWILRRGKAEPLNQLLESVREHELFPGPSTEYSEAELEGGVDRKMRDMTEILRGMYLTEEPWYVNDDFSHPPIVEIMLDDPLSDAKEMVVEDISTADPFGEVPDMYTADVETPEVDMTSYEMVEMLTLEELKKPPSPALSINAEADLLQDILDATDEGDNQKQVEGPGFAMVKVTPPAKIPSLESEATISTIVRTEETGPSSDVSQRHAERRWSYPPLGPTQAERNPRRINQKPRMKRRTMWVTLNDGTKKRINVRKLGLPVYKPYG